MGAALIEKVCEKHFAFILGVASARDSPRLGASAVSRKPRALPCRLGYHPSASFSDFAKHGGHKDHRDGHRSNTPPHAPCPAPCRFCYHPSASFHAPCTLHPCVPPPPLSSLRYHPSASFPAPCPVPLALCPAASFPSSCRNIKGKYTASSSIPR